MDRRSKSFFFFFYFFSKKLGRWGDRKRNTLSEWLKPNIRAEFREKFLFYNWEGYIYSYLFIIIVFLPFQAELKIKIILLSKCIKLNLVSVTPKHNKIAWHTIRAKLGCHAQMSLLSRRQQLCHFGQPYAAFMHGAFPQWFPWLIVPYHVHKA